MRCPSRIAAVVNRSNIFYSLVDKNRRPEKQQPVVESEHVTGHALYVRVDRTEQANGLVEYLAALAEPAATTRTTSSPGSGDETATPEERTSERIRRAEAIVEEDPDRAWEIASLTVAEMGAPDVPNGVSDRGVRRDARATLMRTLALLLAAGEDRKDNVHLRGSLQVGVDMDAETEEEIPDEGSDAHDWAGQKIIRSIEHGVVEFLLTESPDDRPRLKLLEALQALQDAAPRRHYWPDLAVARMQQRLRSGLIDGANDPSSARHYFPDEVEGWLKLTGYHGDAADKAHELCETAIGTLLDAAEADTNETSRNILLGQVENLLHASGWEPLLVARLEEVDRAHRRSAGSIRTGRYGGRRQADSAQAGRVGGSGSAGRQQRRPRVAAQGRPTRGSQTSRTRCAAVRAGTPPAGRDAGEDARRR